MAFRNTGVMCMVFVDGRFIDMGNYFINEENNERVIITRRELAEQYAHLLSEAVYITKDKQETDSQG